jgi:hypothetical protein
MFKRRRFPVEIILLCVRWYCKYGISYRDLSEMMQERGVEVDPTTIMRWIHRYAPSLRSGGGLFRVTVQRRGESTRRTSRLVADGSICSALSTRTAC